MVGRLPLTDRYMRLKDIRYICRMKKYYFRNYNRYILFLWILIGGLLLMQFSAVLPVLELFLFILLISLSIYPVVTHLSTTLLRAAIQKNNMRHFAFQFIGFTLLITIAMTVTYRLFTWLESMIVFEPTVAFSGEDTLLTDFISSLVAALFFNLGFCGLRFFEENLRLQQVLTESHLQVLQLQINPHFMFNVLNHVNVLIRKEPDLASSLLVQYTDILRYQLYSAKEDSITIKQEVEFLKNFIEVEKIRWKNSLDVNCSWYIENEDTEVSPLLFVTFIENAFKHVSRSKSDKGHVNICFEQKGKNVLLSVKNSKYADDPRRQIKKDSGIGLENIKRRLDILYPNRYSLHFNETQKEYSITLSIKQ